jgi:hypothetical protein
MKPTRYRLLKDYFSVSAGTEVQRSVGGDYYPRGERWGQGLYRLPASVVEDDYTFAVHYDISVEDWEIMNLDLSQEFDQ